MPAPRCRLRCLWGEWAGTEYQCTRLCCRAVGHYGTHDCLKHDERDQVDITVAVPPGTLTREWGRPVFDGNMEGFRVGENRRSGGQEEPRGRVVDRGAEDDGGQAREASEEGRRSEPRIAWSPKRCATMCCMCNEDALGSGGAAIPCSWPTCSCLMCGAWCAPGSWSGGLLCRHRLGLQEQTPESQEMLGRASGLRETVRERDTNSREDRVQPLVDEREHSIWAALGKSAVVQWRRSRKKGVYITECIDGFRGLEF